MTHKADFELGGNKPDRTTRDATATASSRPRKASVKISIGSKTAAEDRDADRTSLKQVRKTFVFLGFVAIAYAAYLAFTGQVDDFIISLAGVDPAWLIAGVLCFLFYYVFGVLAYTMLVVTNHNSPVGFRDLMSVEASGVFFMRLTPGGAGVIPAQIYRLTRAGLSVSDAGALQFVRFALYEAGEGVFAGIMLLLCGTYFLNTFADTTILGLNVTWIGIFMFGFKFVQVSGVVLLCLLPKPVQKIGVWGLRAGHKLHILNDERYERFSTTLNTQIDSFATAFRTASANWRNMLLVELITLLQLGCMYALPYFVLRSFGLEADLLICLASGSMVELLVNAIPLPGGTGGAEVGFAILFKPLFGWHLTAGFVIWRAVEYLLPVLIAAPCMGMRSTTGESIYNRWHRRGRNVARVVQGKSASIERGGIAYSPSKKARHKGSKEGRVR